MLGWMLRRREGKGQALTELAIAIPVLALMIFGLIEVGFIIKTRLVLQDAIRSAVRYGAEEGTQTTASQLWQLLCSLDLRASPES